MTISGYLDGVEYGHPLQPRRPFAMHCRALRYPRLNIGHAYSFVVYTWPFKLYIYN
jgi:hypothetical protein